MLFYYFSLKLHIKMLALKLYSVSWEKTLLIKILCGICYDFFMHCNNGVFSLFDRMSELHVQVKHNITLPYFHCTHLTAMYKYTHEDTHISSHPPPPPFSGKTTASPSRNLPFCGRGFGGFIASFFSSSSSRKRHRRTCSSRIFTKRICFCSSGSSASSSGSTYISRRIWANMVINSVTDERRDWNFKRGIN